MKTQYYYLCPNGRHNPPPETVSITNVTKGVEESIAEEVVEPKRKLALIFKLYFLYPSNDGCSYIITLTIQPGIGA